MKRRRDAGKEVEEKNIHKEEEEKMRNSCEEQGRDANKEEEEKKKAVRKRRSDANKEDEANKEQL